VKTKINKILYCFRLHPPPSNIAPILQKYWVFFLNPGALVYAYNPRFWGGRDQFETSLGKKQDSISTNKKLGVVVHACHPTYVANINRRISVQVSSGINMSLSQK
jgi:hypothetical protein